MSFLDHSYTLVVTDASIKNNMATSIAHIHICDKPIIKTLHYVMKITSTKAEFFFIRYNINKAVNIPGISKIVIIIDSIHTMKRISDSSLHLFQIHTMSILNKLREFFLLSTNNSIKFWECQSHCNWLLHKTVDRETKQSHQIPLFSCKSS